MGLLSRIFRPSAAKHAEGQYRSGPYYLPLTGGWLPDGAAWNWWQLGHDPLPGWDRLAIVEACVSAYAQTIAMCPGDHWRALGNGGRERVANSALRRILQKPNTYQTISDFKLNLVRALYTHGNAYALAVRNDRYEIAELHLMDPQTSGPRVAVDGSLFYRLSGNELIERRFGVMGVDPEALAAVPARDVLHVRLHTPRHQLQGESPLAAVALDLAASNTMLAQQLAFYTNKSTPSYVMGTDAPLTIQQINDLSEKYNEVASGMNSGKVPIAAHGLKPYPLHVTAQDQQLIETLKMTQEHIALAFRVPLQILGIGGTPYASTELLMQSWLASGLGFALNQVEQAFDALFGLRGEPDEYTEFDTKALMRSAFKDRVQAYKEGVQGGIFEPNYARAEFELPAVEYGDEPRVQQQVVPLSAAAAIPSAPPAPPADSQPAPTNSGSENAGRNLRELVRVRRLAA